MASAALPVMQADFMAHAQMSAAAKVFTTPVANSAWKLKPSWYMVAQDDKLLNPTFSGCTLSVRTVTKWRRKERATRSMLARQKSSVSYRRRSQRARVVGAQ